MPLRKRNKYQAAIMKQHKLIRKKLMEISIRVDNHVYNNKPISATEAEQYLREIPQYKIQCSSDIHMLQVIEKLTRCMKLIIKETTNNSNIIVSHLEQMINMSVGPSVDKEKVGTGVNDIIVSDNDTEKPNVKSCDGNKPQNFVIEIGKQNYNINETSVKCSTDKENLCDTIFDNILETENIAFTKNMKPSEDQINYNNSRATTKRNNNKPESNKTQVKATKLKSVKLIKNTHPKFTPPIKSHENDTKEKNDSDGTKKYIYQENNVVSESNIVKEVKINTSVDAKQTLQQKRKRVPKMNDNKEITNTLKLHNEKRKRRAANKKLSNNSEPSTSVSLPANNTNSYKTSNNSHTCVDLVNKEVYFTTSGEQRNEFRNLVENQESLNSKQMENLKKDNQRLEDDLSWINTIKYVRQMSTAEFSPQLNNLEESWNDNELLLGCKDA